MADNRKDEFYATSSSRAEIDWFVFGSASFILLILILCLAAYPCLLYTSDAADE